MGKREQQKPPRFYRVKDAAEILALSIKTVYRMYDKGELPGASFGGAVRISRAGLEEYIARHSTQGRKEDVTPPAPVAEVHPQPRAREKRRKAGRQPTRFKCIPRE